jgi:hypothetical protein
MTSNLHPIALAFPAWCKLAALGQVSLSSFMTSIQKIMVSAMAALGFFRVAVVFAVLIYTRMTAVVRIVLSNWPVSVITLTKEIYNTNAFLFADTGSLPGVLVQTNIDNGLSKTSSLSFTCNC